jgi:hypothetical protein
MVEQLAKEGSAAIFCNPYPALAALPLSGCNAQLMLKKWVEKVHFKN